MKRKQTFGKYTVTNHRRFLFTAMLFGFIVASLVYYGTLGIQAVYASVLNENQVEEQTFVFESNGVKIIAASQEEFIDKLEGSLKNSIHQTTVMTAVYEQAVQDKTEAEAKYEQIEKRYNQILAEKAAVEKAQAAKKKQEDEKAAIREEYGYALNYPGSDVTIADVKMVQKLCKEYGNVVDPHLWFSLVELESGYNSKAKSKSSSAAGWGQVIRGTAEWIYEDALKLGNYNHSTMGTNKEINARISIYYLSSLIKEYGVKKALIRYNGGELGVRYANIVSTKLEKNSDLTLKQVAAKAASYN